jgi:chaperonin cofactor prefoldin
MKKEYLESLFEDVKEKFDLVMEGQQGLHREIKEMRQEMNDRFELVDFKIETLNKKIDNVEVTLNKKIDNVEVTLNKKIDSVDAKLSNKIDGVEKSLKDKIVRVEKKVDRVAADLTAHRADTESHGKGYKASDS